MLYSTDNTSFKHQVHPTLQKRLRIFLILGAIMILLIVSDVVRGLLPLWIAAVSLVIGSIIGFISSRIFHLSWDTDGERVVSRIDTIGWIVLAAYVLFEIARSLLVQHWLPAEASAITFAFIGPALITRVLGLRGRIIKIIREERVLG